MKHFIALLFSLVLGVLPVYAGSDGDMVIFSDCTSTVEPNILIIMDTSFSMYEQDVWDSKVPGYDKDFDYCNEYGTCKKSIPEKSDEEEQEAARKLKMQKIYYQSLLKTSWTSFLSLWVFGGIEHVDDLTCESAIKSLEKEGFYEGYIDAGDGDCDKYIRERLHVTANYLNYEEYVKTMMDDPIAKDPITFANGVSGTTYDDDDLEHYNPDTDYYRYITRRYSTTAEPLVNAGYGRYETDVNYTAETDRVYVDMGGVRPYSSVFHPGGIKVSDIACESVKQSLLANGWAYDKVYETKECNCVGYLLDFAKNFAVRKLLLTQNFLNYMEMKKSRRYNAINAVHNVAMSNITSVRYGIMQFDLAGYYDVGDLTHYKSDGGDLSMPCGGSLYQLRKVLFERYDKSTDKELGQSLYFGYNGMLFDDISKETPLAETLIEAGLYFSGQESWFNNYPSDSGLDSFFDGTHSNHEKLTTPSKSCYKSPIECPDQINQVIIITDGSPKDDFEAFDAQGRAIIDKKFAHFSGDGSVTGTIIGDYDEDNDDCLTSACLTTLGFKGTWLDDVAKFLHSKDMSPLDGVQNVITNTINFRMSVEADNSNPSFLANTALNGGGLAFTADNQQGIEDAIISMLKGLVKSSTFSSAVTPVRQDDLTHSGNKVFLTSFKVADGKRGQGNIRKFHRDGSEVKGKLNGTGDYVDLLNSSDKINEKVKDDWFVSFPSGHENEDAPNDGAAGKIYVKLLSANVQDSDSSAEKLVKISGVRNVITANDTTTGKLVDLITGANPISIPDSGSATGMNGDVLTAFLLEHVYGYQADWPLGHIVHSNVIVANDPNDSGGDDIYVFAGASDGMFHCFDSSGDEVWAFIPPSYHSRLYELKNTNDHPWFLDGNVTLYHEVKYYKENGDSANANDSDVAYTRRDPNGLIFGERRGGYSYHLLDVSDVQNPVYRGTVGENGDGWGQSWSKPRLCRLADGAGGLHNGFVVGGGYDENQDKSVPGEDSKGKFIAICSAGGSVSKIDTLNSGSGEIEACIIGVRVSDVDHDAKRVFSNIYAGDLKGNVYHFSDNYYLDEHSRRLTRNSDDLDSTFPERRRIFKGPEFTATKSDGSTFENYQKIFYAPILGDSCNGGKIYFGTGDREHPNITWNSDSIYSLNDVWNENSTPAEQDDLIGFDLSYSNSVGKFDYYEVTPKDNNPTKATAKGWYIDLMRSGEKVISEPIVLGNILIMGTYTPGGVTTQNDQDFTGFPQKCNASCATGEGRVYVITTCVDNISVKSIKTDIEDPMPQPAIIFDKDTGRVLISTGDGGIYDPEISVSKAYYWKHSGADL